MNGQPAERRDIERMTRMISHRGPDGEGLFLEGSVALGHRRLSILDLSSAGAQPMRYEPRPLWIVFNGEIYNFVELRKELEADGFVFRTGTDTEVILAAYLRWGEDCQLHFNGMWAFAIWDPTEQVLFLSRDRYGVKPLHYFFDGAHIAFSSEMKSFLPLPWFPFEYDAGVVARAVTDNNLIEGTEDCLLKHIRRLRGGYCLTVRRGAPPRLRRWWNTLDHLVEVGSTLQEQSSQFRDLFLDACNVRMRSDVPLGVALSGGLDSSSVLSSMAALKRTSSVYARHPAQWDSAFVAQFPGTIQDETHHAREVIRHTGVKGVFLEMNIEKGIEHLDRILFDNEEVYDFSAPIWLTYKAMRDHGVVVSIDGHGGDELLGGYHFYFPIAIRDAEMTPLGQQRVADLQEIHRLWQATGEYPEDPPPVDQSGWLRVPQAAPDFSDFLTDQFRLSGSDALTRQLYFDFHYRCLPTILRNFDRCSMSNGVEIRAPFMDWRLVTYCFSLPTFSKLGQGFTKLILRSSLLGILPDSIVARRSKLGFVSPMANWTGGVLRPFLLDCVASQAFREHPIMNGERIKAYIEQSYQSGFLRGIVPVWRYIQAHRVMQLFQQRRRELQSEWICGGTTDSVAISM